MTDKVTISSIVASQFPDFIKEDYGLFVSFVKAYYEFLEQSQSIDLKTIRDIDTTLDEYVKYFKKEYASNIPNILSNNRFVLSNIKDMNLAKGTEEAFRLLFRILFDKEIEMAYPSAQMLRLSDGRWHQNISIFIGVVDGDVGSILNKQIEIVTSSGIIHTFVEEYRAINITIDGRDVYEIIVSRKFFGNVQIDDQIRYDGTFIARIVPTISDIKIKRGGQNFRVGEIYEIGTTGTILKITKTDNLGAILSAQIIDFSMDEKYADDFTYFLVSKKDIAKNLAVPTFNISFPSPTQKDLGLTDKTTGFSEFGTINKFDYNVDPGEIAGPAIGYSYAGELIRSFSDSSTTVTQEESDAVAWVEITIGSISRYPGYYTSNNGFLDDAMFIQDGRFYQAYSYVIKVDEKLESYKSAVKTLLHPAGTALFGEYAIQNQIDLSTSLESMIKSLLTILRDVVHVADNKDHLDVGKLIEEHVNNLVTHQIDQVTTGGGINDSGSDNIYGSYNISNLGIELFQNSNFTLQSHTIYNVGDQITDVSTSVPADTCEDTASIGFGKVLSGDFVTVLDGLEPFGFGKTITETLVSTDNKDHFVIDKVLIETLAPTDNKDHFVIDKVLAPEYITLDDPHAIQLNSYKYDTQGTTDDGGVWKNPYLEDMSTFANDGADYMENKTAF